MGAVYYPSNGWCHLYSICPETESYVGAVAIRRKVSPFSFLEVHSPVTKQIALRGEAEMAEKDGLEKLQELAVSLPIALVNLTNYSGLISSGKNVTHLNIAYRFGNYSKDLEPIQRILSYYMIKLPDSMVPCMRSWVRMPTSTAL